MKKYMIRTIAVSSVLSFTSCDGGGGQESRNNPTNDNLAENVQDPSSDSSPPVDSSSGDQNTGSNDSNDDRDENVIASAKEDEMIALVRASPLQQRASITFDLRLSKVARKHAEDMRDRGFFSHTNPDGDGANYRAIDEGYSLPRFYSTAQNANNIESIAAGNASAEETLQQWTDSPGHRSHLFGEIDFYRAQTNVGVGYAEDPNSPYRYYWVFLAAPPQ